MLEAAFTLCALGALSVFAGYPAALLILARLRPQPWKESEGFVPTVSIITVARESEALLRTSLENFDELEYPRDKLELILYEDGPQSAFLATLGPRPDIKTGYSTTHRGKAHGLNQAAALATGQILVFKDADAIYPPDVLYKLLAPLADPNVGGVCGRRVITENGAALERGQRAYISLDCRLKQAESLVGSITSNDGKIFAVRRELLQHVPDAVTDDLYMGLQVVAQGKRLVFQPAARAGIPVPSRSVAHEMERRRRIVSTSLRGIWLNRRILNPFRYGVYAVGLFINKVLRRMLPFFALGMICTSFMLAGEHWLFMLVFLAACAGLLGVLPLPARMADRLPRCCAAARANAQYAVLGNTGVMLGWYDFLCNRRTLCWTPKKSG